MYRREAFIQGLRAVGYDVFGDDPGLVAHCRPGDVLVIWNRYGVWHDIASRFESKGGVVLVAENAYVGLDRKNRQRYAIARSGHNGSGQWVSGGPERWASLGVELTPWRETGDHILVCPNRCFGMPGFIMDSMWPEKILERLRKLTKRPVRVRRHPGNAPPTKPLAADLANAWAVVIWASSAGCEALISGIPVYCEAPWWIARDAAITDLRSIEAPPLLDRLPAMQKLAWAQWSVDEIKRGEPFSYLLDRSHTLAHCM